MMAETETLPGRLIEVGCPTTLDIMRKAMLVFASGPSVALKRFLVRESVGQSSLFWQLAQSHLARGYDENCRGDDVVGRKKELGIG